MLEILLIVALTKKIGAMVREKGRSAGGYMFLAVGLWIGGEVFGVVVGGMLSLGFGAYGLGLLGAATGALVAYVIAKNVSPVRAELPDAAVFD